MTCEMFMKPEECIFFQLAKASQAAVRFWSRQVSSLGVTAVQGMVLCFLSDRDGVTAGLLGERTRLDSATLTGVIDRLESLGLVARRPHDTDRRSVVVCLTDEGKNTARKATNLMERSNREFFHDMTEQDEAAFRAYLVHFMEKE